MSKKKVLFICVHNSARSQIAEAFLRKHGASHFVAQSAGLEPGSLNPFVVKAMAEVGCDISGSMCKSVFDLRNKGENFDIVVSVCSPEAAERCPVFPGVSKKLHWPFEDPSTFQGSNDEIMMRVRMLRDRIEGAIKNFVETYS